MSDAWERVRMMLLMITWADMKILDAIRERRMASGMKSRVLVDMERASERLRCHSTVDVRSHRRRFRRVNSCTQTIRLLEQTKRLPTALLPLKYTTIAERKIGKRLNRTAEPLWSVTNWRNGCLGLSVAWIGFCLQIKICNILLIIVSWWCCHSCVYVSDNYL